MKYNRSLHSTISLGTTSDDRFMPKGYVEKFASLPDLTLSEKLDGQNNGFTKRGLYARSHTSTSIHPWDKYLVQRWESLKNDIGDYEIFGEGMYGVHSIEYTKMDSIFYVFGVRVKDTYLSWEEVCFIAEMFDFPTVPTVTIKNPLSSFASNDEDKQLNNWLTDTLGMSWVDYTNTSGQLGGIDVNTNKEACEGFVIRNPNEYSLDNKLIETYPNEFGDLFKLVRPKHVQTNEHWTKTWKPCELIESSKYKWDYYGL